VERFIGVFSLLGGFTLAGTSVIAGRFVSEILGTFTIAAVSLFFALLGLLPLCARNLVQAIRQMPIRDWASLLVQALFGIFLFRMFLLQGLIRTSAGEAGVLTGATPAVTVVLARLILKEPLDMLRLLGVVSTVTGILVLQGVFLTDIGFSREHLIGNLLVLCAAMCESLFNVISRISSIKASLNQSQELNPTVQTTLVVGIALLLCLGPALGENPVNSLMSLGIAGWGALVWYGVFVTALAFILWYAGIKRCDISVAAAFSGMMPFTALVLSVMLLDEQPGWQQWLGGLIVVIGMVLTGSKLPAVRQENC
jgi:drug/metabolite transporter (DMT)-like permease